ncbi:hypothetical protein N7523_010953 [Penicillium sp. IBT 18751x]|nr:hypothetical protein N7523_010953 [Penicillium sp. IBT 18751x]
MAPTTDNTTRGVILGLKMAGKGNADIAEIVGMTPGAISMLYFRALKKGFDPEKRPLGVSNVFFGKGSTQSSPNKAKIRASKTPPIDRTEEPAKEIDEEM